MTLTAGAAGALSVALWHPFTARSIGWTEDDLAVSHSRPHVAALRQLSSRMGARCRIEYLTDGRLPSFTEDNGLAWRFWPRSLRAVRRSDQFRREWSFSALAATAIEPADVTIINTSGHGGPFTRMLARALRRRRRPYIAMIGGFHATVSGAQLEYFRHSSAVAVHNSALRDRLIASGLPAEHVVLVPLGVDTTHFAPPESPSGSSRRPTLLYVGRLAELKGVDRLIHAVAALKTRYPDLVLNIVGPPSEPKYLSALHRLVGDLAIGDRVDFLGALPYDALPPYYQAATLLVLPSASEGFGMVVVESMACGTPVVALNASGGPLDIITDGHDGRLVEEGRLANEIGALLSTPSRLWAMRAAARRTAIDRYSEATTARVFEALLTRAMSRALSS
jgi:glycosyltransferase involved in cell wall biosynthesis